MTTVVGIALWLTLAAAGWWLARRAQLLLNYAEDLLANATKDRRPAGSRTAEPIQVSALEPDPDRDHSGLAVQAEFVPDPDPTTNPIPVQGPATQPAAAVIDDGWERERDAAYAAMLAEIRGTK